MEVEAQSKTLNDIFYSENHLLNLFSSLVGVDIFNIRILKMYLSVKLYRVNLCEMKPHTPQLLILLHRMASPHVNMLNIKTNSN